MEKIKEKYRELTEKNPIFWSSLSYAALAGLIAVVTVLVLFFVLWITGVYDTLETALDLKHNSVVFLVPLLTLTALSAMCMMGGFLMYFHKYKRPKVKSAFRDAVAPALGMEVGKKG